MGAAQLLAIMTTLLVAWCTYTTEASCYSASLCCDGRDNSCYTRGNRTKDINKPIQSVVTQGHGSYSTCYCDEGCGDTGDCCLDYLRTCKSNVLDCEVSLWSAWSSCSRQCGFGSTERQRHVLIEAQNGGLPCPPLSQKRICFGQLCHRDPVRDDGVDEKRIYEMARIVPDNYASWRLDKKYFPGKDIRRNLFEHYQHFEYNNIRRENYCVDYEITWVHPSCSYANGYSSLRKGSIVCSSCQKTAMKTSLGHRCVGEGLIGRETHWGAVNAHNCDGYWIRRNYRAESCPCHVGNGEQFTFV